MKYLFYMLCALLIAGCGDNQIPTASEDEVSLCPTEELNIGVEYKDPFFDPSGNSALFPSEWKWNKSADTLKIFSRLGDDTGESLIDMFNFLIVDNCITPISNKQYSIQYAEISENGYLVDLDPPEVNPFREYELGYNLQEYIPDSLIIGEGHNIYTATKMFVELLESNFVEDVIE